LLKTSAAHVQIDAVKRAEDSPRTVVRLHEFTGQRGTVQCDSDLEIQSWQCCNVLESPIGEVYSGPIEFSIAPYEIKTLLIEWKA
jgi:alpha-mannosidase